MEHVSVLLKETIEALAVKPGGRYVDGTFGRGGHSKAIIAKGGEVLGIDRDDEAIAAAGDIKVVKGNHGNLKELTNEHGWKEVDGILLDLGVSSPQLDDAGRGFSFLRDGPLDMRMDQSSGVSAVELVNEASEGELSQMFWELGEEREARRVAKAIVKTRETKRLTTTMELANLVEATIGRHGGHHPATKVFQALRMKVNDELGELERALNGGIKLLKAGGRFAVITFESITDRKVKQFFASHIGKMESLQQGGERWVGEEPRARAVTRKAIHATEKEIQTNPRSRSAKLRVIERT